MNTPSNLIPRPQPPSQQRGQRVGRPGLGERVAAVGAGLLLMVLLIGPPLLFARFVGWPLPHAMPHLAAIRLSLNGWFASMPWDAVIKTIAVIAWLAWAHFTYSVLTETVTQLRHQHGHGHGRARVPKLGVLGVNQVIARKLVATVLIAVASTAATVSANTGGITLTHARPAATATANPSLRQGQWNLLVDRTNAAVEPVADVAALSQAPALQSAANPTVAPVSGHSKTYTVQPPDGGFYDTLWGIAQRHLGAGDRYKEILALNVGRVQHDGGVLHSDSLIRPGWVLLMPADATGTNVSTPAPPLRDEALLGNGPEVTVAAGDTLSGIAAEHDINNYQQLFAANIDRAEPTGAHFTDPNLIRPGWTITLPATDPTSAPIPAPAITGTADAPTPTEAGTAQVDATPGADSQPTVPAPAPTQSPTLVSPEPTRAPTASSASGADNPAGARTPADIDSPDHAAAAVVAPFVAFAGGGVLLAGMTLAALTVLRRRQFRHRRPGRTVPATPADLGPIEKALTHVGETGIADVRWLDDALRSLVHTAHGDETAGPDVIAVRMSNDVIELVLAGDPGSPPVPWRADDTGTRWKINREDLLVSCSTGGPCIHLSPYPTLATVGYGSDGAHWLLDLEHAGAISLAGDPQRCLNLARFLAAELGHNVWSENLRVTVVGFGAEMAALNPERITHTDDIDQAINLLHAMFTTSLDMTHTAGISVIASRLRDGVVGDGWPPHVLLIAPGTATESVALTRLLTAIRTDPARTGIAVVVAGTTDLVGATRQQLTLDSAGNVTIPALDVELTAQQLPAEEAADLAALLAFAATTDDRPMPTVDSDHPWDTYADAAGAPRTEWTTDQADGRAINLVTLEGCPDGSVDPDDLPGTAPRSDSVLPLPADQYLATTSTTTRDIAVLAPRIGPQVRRRIENADTQLDADLAAWWEPAPTLPKLTLLGPVALFACGATPDKRREYLTEIVAYLATRPYGASGDELREALHPGESGDAAKSTMRNGVSRARQWLGVNPATGQHHLPYAAPGPGETRYRLQGLLVDADLFRRLRLRGVARGAEGIGDLQRALDLVTGMPFDRQRGRDGYRWLLDAGDRLDVIYTAAIIDVAHTLATRYLADQRPDLALAAAGQALKADASDDVTLLDLIFACDALDNRAEADHYLTRIIANHGAEIPEDLPPRTYDILRRRHLPSAS